MELGLKAPFRSNHELFSSQAHAFLQSRGYVTPHDVKTFAHDVLRHRIILTYEAEAEGKAANDIVRRILDNVPVP